MHSVIFYACLLLTPVALLLFIAIRLKKTITYPHGLTLLYARKKPTDFLIRFLRLYADLFFDVLLALAVAFFIAGYPRVGEPKTAAVVDCSLSMTRGFSGSTPLDLAIRETFNNKDLSAADLYFLEYDRSTKKTRLSPAGTMKDEFNDSLSLTGELDKRGKFFSVDYSILSGLSGKGYGKITLLTDNENLDIDGVEIKIFPSSSMRFSYPTQGFFDPGRDESTVFFRSRDSSRLQRILVNTDGSDFRPAKPEAFHIEKSPSGFALHIKTPGVWAIEENGRLLPFNAPDPGKPPRSEGLLAEKIAETLFTAAQTASASKPQLVISEKRNKKKADLIRIAAAEKDACVLEPSKTLGALVASGYDGEKDFALTRASFASDDSSLAFLTALNRINGLTNSIPAEGDSLERAGDGYLVRGNDGTGALYAAPEEYFPFPETLDMPEADLQIPHYLIFIILAGIFALKAFIALKRPGSVG